MNFHHRAIFVRFVCIQTSICSLSRIHVRFWISTVYMDHKITNHYHSMY